MLTTRSILGKSIFRRFVTKSFASRSISMANEVKKLRVEDLHTFAADNKDCLVIDVREKDEIDLVALDKVKFEHKPMSEAHSWLENMELDFKVPIVCVCHHGVRSMRVGMALASIGYENVYNLEGGIHRYAVAVDNTIGTY